MDPQSSSPDTTQSAKSGTSAVLLPETMNPTLGEEHDEVHKLENKIQALQDILKSIKEHYHKTGENLRAIQEEKRNIQSIAEQIQKQSRKLDVREARLCTREEDVRSELKRAASFFAEGNQRIAQGNQRIRQAEKYCVAQNHLTQSLLAEKQALVLANSVQADEIKELQLDLRAFRIAEVAHKALGRPVAADTTKYETPSEAARLDFDRLFFAYVHLAVDRRWNAKQLRLADEHCEQERLLTKRHVNENEEAKDLLGTSVPVCQCLGHQIPTIPQRLIDKWWELLMQDQ
jgi:hypothetical protein